MSLLSRTVKTIATHSGVFHCDEVLGCCLLKLIYPDAQIIRTRDQKILDTCDLVLDVGSEYNVDNLRFDHHQRTFNETFGSVLKRDKFTVVRLSSAGLIYCHYGMEILKKISSIPDEAFLELLFEKLYHHLIQEVDGIDNGIPMFDGEPLYHISTHLSARVKRLNKHWNETDGPDEMERFKQAMALTLEEFNESVKYYSNVWWPARKLVYEAIKHRFNLHKSGQIMELTTPCPWKSIFFEVEPELDIVGQIKFAIFPDDFSENYRVMAVPVTENSFVLRTPLHKSWMGLRDEELSEKSGIPDCIFAHANGFIGGHKNRAGALLMAVKTLELVEQEEKNTLNAE